MANEFQSFRMFVSRISHFDVLTRLPVTRKLEGKNRDADGECGMGYAKRAIENER